MTKTTLMFLTLLSSIVSFSQTDEKDVALRVEALRQAMLDGKREALSSIAADGLNYGHSSGLVEDKAAFIENFVSGNTDFVTIALSEQTIHISGDAAVVRHHLMADTNNGGTAGKANISVLLVWQKQKGVWKLLARQAVKL